MDEAYHVHVKESWTDWFCQKVRTFVDRIFSAKRPIIVVTFNHQPNPKSELKSGDLSIQIVEILRQHGNGVDVSLRDTETQIIKVDRTLIFQIRIKLSFGSDVDLDNLKKLLEGEGLNPSGVSVLKSRELKRV